MGSERWHARRDALRKLLLAFKHRCLLLAALLACAHLLRFDVAGTPIVTDVRYYVYFATRVADGAVPHRDFFDNKTQLATMAGAALVTAGRGLGIDPLTAMRAGYVALSGVAALLLFVIQRRLYAGSCAAGLVGMLCYLGFSLLGFLPAIGPLPKLLMGVTASLAALAAQRGAWTLAGVLGGVAFLDWQIGVLAGLGVFVAALLERERPVAKAAQAAIGGLAALAAACVYFVSNGALGVVWRQVVLTSLARGESALAGKTFTGRLLQIHETLLVACPGHAWLAVIGVAGMLLFPLLILRHRGTPLARLVIALGVYHYGIVAFSLTDYQAYGDLFALLASLAFFAGVALNEVLRCARAIAPTPQTSHAIAVGGVVVALLVLRIGRPRLDITLPDKIARGATTLTEQQSVARAIVRETAGLRTVLVNCPEQLFLTGMVNPVPFGFWNRATSSYFRATPEERPFETVRRLLDATNPQAIVCATPRLEHDLVKSGAYERLALAAETGGYGVVLLRRRAGGALPAAAGSAGANSDEVEP